MRDDATMGQASRPAEPALHSLGGYPRELGGVADYSLARTLRPHLLRSAVFLAMTSVFVMFWIIGLTFSTLSSLSQVGVRIPDPGPEVDSALTLLGLGGILVFGFGWLISLTVSVREFVDEGSILLRRAADRRDAVCDVLHRLFEERCPPFECDTARERSTLFVSGPQLSTVVTVSPTGTDLHIGWSMWRSRSTIRLIGMVFADLVRGAQSNTLRVDQAVSCAAMRDVIHDVASEVLLALPAVDPSADPDQTR